SQSMHTTKSITRRQLLGGLAYAGAAALLPVRRAAAQTNPFAVAGRPVEFHLTAVSPHTIRISVVPLDNAAIVGDGSLVQQTFPGPEKHFAAIPQTESLRLGDFTLLVSRDPLSISLENRKLRLTQKLLIDQQTGSLTFALGQGPILGLGEGGPQF